MIYAQLMGGLGNQLFIYSFCKRLSVETGNKVVFFFDSEDGRNLEITQFCLDESFEIIKDKFPVENISNIKIYKLFRKIIEHLPNGNMHDWFVKLASKFGVVFILEGYVEIDYKALKRLEDIIVVGFFQSSKYIDCVKDVIVPEFEMKPKYEKLLRSETMETLALLKQENAVCLHIRLGDYLKPMYKERFLVCTDMYYQKAIKIIKNRVEKPVFYIFSDSIELVKNTMPYLADLDVRFIDNGGEQAVVIDFLMMRNCKHFIMSNSTLSWWAQYLSSNSDKIVIAPNKWLKTGYDNRDIYQEHWIQVEV